jgi:hypothetical protein
MPLTVSFLRATARAPIRGGGGKPDRCRAVTDYNARRRRFVPTVGRGRYDLGASRWSTSASVIANGGRSVADCAARSARRRSSNIFSRSGSRSRPTHAPCVSQTASHAGQVMSNVPPAVTSASSWAPSYGHRTRFTTLCVGHCGLRMKRKHPGSLSPESLVRLLVCETPPFRSRQDRTTRTAFGRGRLWVMAVHAERPVARRQTAHESLSRQADRADTRASENRQADRVHGPAPDNRKREPRSRRREASRYRACGVALLEQTGLERPDQPLVSGAHRN